jgi:hypothetical protein
MSYAWSFNGQFLSDSAYFEVLNPSAGWYYLDYTDFRGDTYHDSMYVSFRHCEEHEIGSGPGLLSEAELELPTWFNPTLSQYWRPHTRDIEWMELTIYNTLGQVIQRYTGHPDNYGGWDGFAIAQGVFFATVNARAYNGEQLRTVEKVMLVRQ